MVFPTTNLYAYYKLDNSTTDETGNGHTLTFNGGFTYNSSGKINQSGTKSSGNGYAATGITSFGNSGYSINFWLKRLVDTGGDEDILYKGTPTNAYRVPYAIELNASNQIMFYMGGGGSTYTLINSTSTINVGTWYMVTVTWDGTNNANSMKFYLNASLQSQGTFAGSYQSNAYDTLLLGFSFGGTLYQRGQYDIDEVGFWNGHVLNSTEITTLYNSGAGLQYNAGYGNSVNGVTFSYINGVTTGSVSKVNGV